MGPEIIPSIHLSIPHFLCLSIYPSPVASTHPFICPSTIYSSSLLTHTNPNIYDPIPPPLPPSHPSVYLPSLSPSTLSPTHLSSQSCTYPPTHLSMHHLATHPPIHHSHPYSHPSILLTHQSVDVPSHPSLHLHSHAIIFILSVIHPSIHLFITYAPTHLSTHSSVIHLYPSIFPIHSSILTHLSTHLPLLSLRLLSHPLFIHLPFCPSILLCQSPHSTFLFICSS